MLNWRINNSTGAFLKYDSILQAQQWQLSYHKRLIKLGGKPYKGLNTKSDI